MTTAPDPEEAKTVTASAITPVASKDVNLTAHLETVDTALKSRAKATKVIKTKWAAVQAVLHKYEVAVPARRPTVDRVYDLRNNFLVYEEKPPVPEDIEAYIQAGTYDLRELSNEKKTMQLLEKEFPGITERFEQIVEGVRQADRSREIDREATAEARKEFDAAAQAYVEAIEAYDETTESVANVKEYIGIMKEVADISAIAQGIKGNS